MSPFWGFSDIFDDDNYTYFVYKQLSISNWALEREKHKQLWGLKTGFYKATEGSPKVELLIKKIGV